MEHREYIKISDNADTAVVMVHGILGTPRFFDKFIPFIPKEFSVFNILLDGHGKDVESFSHTSMKKWKTHFFSLINRLSHEYKKIIIIGHSMGGLLAVEAAIRYEKVAMLILLGMPLKLNLKMSVFKISVKYVFNINQKRSAVHSAMKNVCSIEPSGSIIKHIRWAMRFFELFCLIKTVRKNVSEISVPCFAFYSKGDEAVSVKSADILKSNSHCKCFLLEKSRHYYYTEKDIAFILSKVKKITFKKDC